ncbi:MAG: TfoX/Sxy family protein [Pseudomonadota bacterium]
MSVSDEDIAHALELFEGLGDLTTRKMMGGLCIYCDGTIFAIIHPHGGVLIKGAGPFAEELEAMGLEKWHYLRKDGSPTNMPYWHLPDSALDDPDEARDLARRALEHL